MRGRRVADPAGVGMLGSLSNIQPPPPNRNKAQPAPSVLMQLVDSEDKENSNNAGTSGLMGVFGMSLGLTKSGKQRGRQQTKGRRKSSRSKESNNKATTTGLINASCPAHGTPAKLPNNDKTPIQPNSVQALYNPASGKPSRESRRRLAAKSSSGKSIKSTLFRDINKTTGSNATTDKAAENNNGQPEAALLLAADIAPTQDMVDEVASVHNDSVCSLKMDMFDNLVTENAVNTSTTSIDLMSLIRADAIKSLTGSSRHFSDHFMQADDGDSASVEEVTIRDIRVSSSPTAFSALTDASYNNIMQQSTPNVAAPVAKKPSPFFELVMLSPDPPTIHNPCKTTNNVRSETKTNQVVITDNKSAAIEENSRNQLTSPFLSTETLFPLSESANELPKFTAIGLGHEKPYHKSVIHLRRRTSADGIKDKNRTFSTTDHEDELSNKHNKAANESKPVKQTRKRKSATKTTSRKSAKDIAKQTKKSRLDNKIEDEDTTGGTNIGVDVDSKAKLTDTDKVNNEQTVVEKLVATSNDTCVQRRPARARGAPNRLGSFAATPDVDARLAKEDKRVGKKSPLNDNCFNVPVAIATAKTDSSNDDTDNVANRAQFTASNQQYGDAKSSSWSRDELMLLKRAHQKADATAITFWDDIANIVGTRSAKECRAMWFREDDTDNNDKTDKTVKTTQVVRRKVKEDDIFDATPMREAQESAIVQQHKLWKIDYGSAIKINPIPETPVLRPPRLKISKAQIREMKRATKESPKRKRQVKQKKVVNNAARALKGNIESNDFSLSAVLTPNCTLKVKATENEDDFWGEMYGNSDSE